jgi:1-aminocyclopropane-1-carboxylate deaminase/D-cysteine desulfhydrase-like pyridoxal-dependent ACC family enzyme
MKIESQEISLPIFKEKDIRLFVKRLDKVRPFISGNKWFKLKYKDVLYPSALQISECLSL